MSCAWRWPVMTLELFAKVPRLTGLNVLAGVKQAVGELGRITSLVRSIIFIASAPVFSRLTRRKSRGLKGFDLGLELCRIAVALGLCP